MNINGKEDEKLPDYVMSFSGENCHVSVLPIIPPPSSTQVIPTNNFLPDNPPSPIVWSTHNFVFHKFPQPLVLAKCKDSSLKLHQSMVGGVTGDWAGEGQVADHSVWGPAGVVGPAHCAREDQTGGDDGQHPETR